MVVVLHGLVTSTVIFLLLPWQLMGQTPAPLSYPDEELRLELFPTETVNTVS